MKKLDRLFLKVNTLRREQIEATVDPVAIIQYDGDLRKWVSNVTSGEYTTLKRALTACENFYRPFGLIIDELSFIVNDSACAERWYEHG